MNILITGGEGNIGKKLVLKLKNLPYSISLLTRQKSSNLDKDFSPRMVTGDLLNIESLYKATENIDLVIHLAGITHAHNEQLYYDINTQGTKYLIEACTKNKVRRFIYISSRAASADGGAYARSKLLAEEEVKKSVLDWIILRPAEVYGAGEKEAITRLIKIIQKSYVVPVLGDGKYTLAPVYVGDVVSAIIASLNTNISKKIYTLAGPEEMTYNELINKILNCLHIKRTKVHVPIPIFRIASLIASILGVKSFVPDQIPRLLYEKSSDISLARRDLHFSPIKFERGLEILLGSKGKNT